MPTVDQFIEAARSYEGVRWVHQGRTRLGIDCIGLLVLSARDIGLEVDDHTDYQRRSAGDDLLRGFYRNCTRVAPATMRRGDMLVFSDRVYPHHAGIFTGTMAQSGTRVPAFIHAHRRLKGSGKVLEQRLDDEWYNRVTHVFRITELEQ